MSGTLMIRPAQLNNDEVQYEGVDGMAVPLRERATLTVLMILDGIAPVASAMATVPPPAPT